MEHSVQGRQGVVGADFVLLLCQPEGRVSVQIFRHQPQIGGIEFQPPVFQRPPQGSHIQLHRQ